MYVVIWEPRSGRGGGHQLVLHWHKADAIRRRMSRDRPDDAVQLLTAEEHSAAAVAERRQAQFTPENRRVRRSQGAR
jgi:hypothetical protein